MREGEGVREGERERVVCVRCGRECEGMGACRPLPLLTGIHNAPRTRDADPSLPLSPSSTPFRTSQRGPTCVADYVGMDRTSLILPSPSAPVQTPTPNLSAHLRGRLCRLGPHHLDRLAERHHVPQPV
jgi:hypothetical protein